MVKNKEVIASGNLAAPRRTIAGVLGQMDFFELDAATAIAILVENGLPKHAFEDVGFPISLSQEISILHALLNEVSKQIDPVTYVFQLSERLGVASFGMVGLTTQHAPSLKEAIRIALDYAQLTWGHSRVVATETDDSFLYALTMVWPKEVPDHARDNAQLGAYCIAIDLLSIMRILLDVMGEVATPLRIDLPFARPSNWSSVKESVPCRVHFESEAATIHYAPELLSAVPLRADARTFQGYERVTKELSRLLADDASMAEQVTRWLWAYSPPLKRGAIAEILNVSERSLSRQLKGEGTSYNALFAQVQCERSQNLLKNPKLTISDVGYRLGYTEPAAFTRAFTSWTGTTPSAWRESIALNSPRA